MLEVKNLYAWWGQAQALFDISLEVRKGELVVLQGLNGAGKSTLLQSIIGIGARTTGAISYKDESKSHILNSAASSMPAHKRAQLGIGFVPEDRRLFTSLSVQDNLRVAVRGSRSDIALNEEKALALFPALKTMLKRPASQMSGGEQQMLSIARSLMQAPSLLLLDEPCEGIAPVLVEQMTEALLKLKQSGLTMLIAEQNQILASHADRTLTLIAGTLKTLH